MIGIDTNVLVRLMANDDPAQSDVVRSFFLARNADDPAYVGSVVLAEAVWVLRSRLGYDMPAIVGVLSRLLESSDLRFQHADRLFDLLNGDGRSIGDLADHIIAWSATEAGCTHTVTFDRGAVRCVPGMELLA